MSGVVSASELPALFEYDPATGKLFRRARGPKWFKAGSKSAEWQSNAWNARFAGKEFGCPDRRGYVWGSLIVRSCVSAHSIVWAMHAGEWPDGVIDHLDGNPANNRIENIRCVPQALNSRNRKISENNASGAPGVAIDKRTGRWRAFITVSRKRMNLGFHGSFDEALRARQIAEKTYGFITRGNHADRDRPTSVCRNNCAPMDGGLCQVPLPSLQCRQEKKDRSMLERQSDARGNCVDVLSLRTQGGPSL